MSVAHLKGGGHFAIISKLLWRGYFMKKVGFDNKEYIRLQSQNIRDRIAMFGDKLYMEFGGKLFDDYHASRVLPGFAPDSKVKMLLELKDEAEIIIAINADAIEKNKRRGDLGITYDLETLRLIDALRGIGLYVGSVVITRFTGQPLAIAFEKRLNSLDIKTYRHYPIADYPANIPLIVSEEGFGKNDYIETERKLIVITAPGPGSGKMATCLSQLYHEHKRGIKAGYAKFETFPIWSIPLKHPVNVAYEAATADLNDVNMIDPFHLEAYGKTAINYNRDIEIFPVLNAIFEGIYGESPYKSPTDMGVNMAGFCISDDEVCCEASKQEIIRRYYTALGEMLDGKKGDEEVNKIALLMKQMKLTTAYRPTTVAAYERRLQSGKPAAAMELEDGTIITADTSDLLGPCAALLLNATKYLAGIDHELKLIPQDMIVPIQRMKTSMLHGNNPRLHTDEVLIALAVLSQHDENCRRALDTLPQLDGCQVHATVMLGEVDRKIFKKLGCGLTCDPVRKV